MKNITKLFHFKKINPRMIRRFLFFFILLAIIVGPNVGAREANDAAQAVDAHGEGENGTDVAMTFLWIAIILISAKLSSIIEKLGHPSVLGELIVGVVLGNLALLGLHLFEPIKADPIIAFLAELGVVILLFQIGLESNIQEMKKVGISAFLVACVGVILPFIFGTYIVGPWLLPGLSANVYLFLGAAMTATSVGITARVFKDLKSLKLPEAQIILGAAVIDDVLGLIILAVVSAIVTVGAVSLGIVSWIIAKAILFLVGSIVLGHFLVPVFSHLFSKIQRTAGMKLTIALAFGLFCAFLAKEIGLAPIVGAFAAGLILDPVQFKYFRDPKVVHDVKKIAILFGGEVKEKILKTVKPHAERHIEDLLEPIGYFLIPIFFVVTGMNVKLETLFNIPILITALGVTTLAFISKIAAGFVASKKMNRLLIGTGMIPRGEVGLIFASIGKELGVISDEVFSIIVIMVILTTLFTPPLLAIMIRKMKTKKAQVGESAA